MKLYISRILRFLSEFVVDFLSYFGAGALVLFVLGRYDFGFTAEQLKFIHFCITTFSIFNFWIGKDKDDCIKSLQEELAVLNRNIPF